MTDANTRTQSAAADCHAAFLAEYASLLFRSGATCSRLERNVGRMAASWGMKCMTTIMPLHIHLTITDSSGHCSTLISSSAPQAISYNLITRLSKLSWNVADRRLSLSQARRLFNEIKKTPDPSPLFILIAASFANAAFCRLFGGDFWAMAIVFLATLAGFHIRQLMLSRRIDIRVTFTVCAAISSVLAAAAQLFALGHTPGIAMATSVLYLVPGIPLLNAFSDLIDSHYICSLSRMIDALILTACLSLGLCIGMNLMNFEMF